MNDSGFFTIKNKEWLANQRIAGKILSGAFDEVKKHIKEGITTKQLDNIIETYILDNKGECTFKGYNGFPCASCLSINRVIVHGIASNTQLQYGDVLKVDAGVTIENSIADAAFSIIIGENKKYQLLLDTCEKALNLVIEHLNKGNARLGDLGWIIEHTAKSINANVVKELTGHGLEDKKPHHFPVIYNFGQKNTGIKLLPNTTICIEPIIVYGDTTIKVLEDNWSIESVDVGMHFERTLFLHENHVEIIA